MKIRKFFHRGTEMNKIAFSEIEDYLLEKGIDADEAFALMADEHEVVYVSNGFVRGLLSDECESGEWHHYFKKEDNHFVACKLQFAAYVYA
jgi:hypothetical protein